jgi:membrane protease YdiL (CAAX protease family)
MRLPAAAVVAGCVLLMARPALLGTGGHPATPVVLLFGALLALGVAVPTLRAAPRPGPGTVAAAVGLGVATFAIGRLIGGGRPPFPFSARLVVLNSLAAVAEEAFFRRLAYDVLSPSGAVGAVAGTAVLFAAVHVTVYGPWVLPLDLAAGLVLGWQRWATGSWAAPAATHVVANLLVLA